ncbi:hypothetical protein ACFO1B_22070 [Dactylosporangium siamense]|uniref:Lipoprotein n=1 Tax=Dactylosporangium siamense TaxID=685454 RepID=A0A919UC30_9ACTN|nr:hypothetical protein [Dactylosporangium siamense]GIG50079.1 hypothetical protein Dsi01nite_081200 [Dactylosporangium siamense]
MRRLALSTFVATLLGLALTGCDKEAVDSPAVQQPTTQASTARSAAGDAYPETEEGAKALLQALPKNPPLVLRLKPTTEDYRALFVGDAAAKAERFYAANLWNDAKLTADAGQTQLQVFKATSDEIRSWSPTAEANFPGGYQQAGPHLKPGFTWYRWRYAEPGKDSGMAYDGLVHVNGHWVWTPKPWRALEG